MASRQATADYILEQIAGAGSVSARKMFGEYGVYCDGKFVASVCDDLFYVKQTAAGRAFIGEIVEAPPYPGAKPCFLIDGAKWDDREWMSRLVQISAAELPAPKPKMTKPKTTKPKAPKRPATSARKLS